MAYKPKGKVKALTGAILKYREKAKEAGVHIPELEAVSKFIGKKGQILKRATRSKRSQERLEEAIAAAKEKFGSRPSQEKIDVELEERKEKAAEQRAKSKKTYRERKKKEKAAAAGDKKVNFRSIAQKATRDYDKVVDVLMDASIKKLMDAYNIGSDLIEYLAEQGLTTQQIKEFIIQMTDTIDDLPEEALQLASMDMMLGTLMEMRETYNEQSWDDVTAMFTMAVTHPDQMQDLHELIGLWKDAGGSENMTFENFRAQMEVGADPFNKDTAREVLGIEPEEDE